MVFVKLENLSDLEELMKARSKLVARKAFKCNICFLKASLEKKEQKKCFTSCIESIKEVKGESVEINLTMLFVDNANNKRIYQHTGIAACEGLGETIYVVTNLIKENLAAIIVDIYSFERVKRKYLKSIIICMV